MRYTKGVNTPIPWSFYRVYEAARLLFPPFAAPTRAEPQKPPRFLAKDRFLIRSKTSLSLTLSISIPRRIKMENATKPRHADDSERHWRKKCWRQLYKQGAKSILENLREEE